MLVVLVVMIVIVLGEGEGVDDLVGVDCAVQPRVVAATTDHNDVSGLGLGHVGCGGLEEVGVGVVAVDDGGHLGVGNNGRGHVAPDVGGGDDADGAVVFDHGRFSRRVSDGGAAGS